MVIWKCGVGQAGKVRRLVGVMLQSRSLNKFSRKGKETIQMRQDARSGGLRHASPHPACHAGSDMGFIGFALSYILFHIFIVSK